MFLANKSQIFSLKKGVEGVKENEAMRQYDNGSMKGFADGRVS